jgi:hypothetical protein
LEKQNMSQNRLMRHLVAVVALGAFATVGCFVVDDTDDDEGGGGESGEDSGGSGGSAAGGKGGTSTGGKGGTSAGGSSTGGSSSGGSSPSGGSSSGGASTGGSSAGGTSGTGPGEGAVMKFCNNLARDGLDAEITLTFAGVEATALTGTCTPVVPNPCIPIPAVIGPEVVLTDTETGTEIISGTIPMLTVADGEEILAVATVDDTDALTVEAGQFAEQYACAETDPYAAMLETRSTPFRLPAARDLRAQNPAAARWTKKAVAPGIGR